MKLTRSNYLLKQFTENKLTASEKEELLLLLQEDDQKNLFEEIGIVVDKESDTEDYKKSRKWRKMLSNVLSVDKVSAKKEKTIFKIAVSKYAYAASVLFFLSFGIWLINKKYHKSDAPLTIVDQYSTKSKVLLLLPDGEKIDIDSKPNGIITKNQHYQITKIQDSILKVSATLSKNTFNNTNNIGVQTLRGGKFRVIMPDGTKVWLNAASSVYFSPLLKESKRIVKISGEVYFEVASLFDGSSQKKVPFFVNIIKDSKEEIEQTIEVLGTHFNVNAYADEKATVATLLEGSVKVQTSGKWPHKALLKPGEQAILTGEEIKVTQADTVAAIAWKNNLFRFKDNDIYSIMRQLARWYNVEIIYDEGLEGERLTGFISKELQLSKTLKTLSAVSNFTFKVENQTVTVSKSNPKTQ